MKIFISLSLVNNRYKFNIGDNVLYRVPSTGRYVPAVIKGFSSRTDSKGQHVAYRLDTGEYADERLLRSVK